LTQETIAMTTAKCNVGVIGLGAMGGGMARSLRRAGHYVHVCDVRSDITQSFVDGGGVVCATPAKMAATCDVIM
jgi:putative dehydrogenase